MRDIPMFVTENGAASLTLAQIPYLAVAYIQLHDCADPEAMLQECCDFCRSAGAEKVYAWGHPVVERFPFYASVQLFKGIRSNLPETNYLAEPVTEEELERWREIYNQKMTDVACAAYMTIPLAKQYCKDGTGYMVREPQGRLCGIGTVNEDRIGALISLYPGLGGDVLCALAKHITSERIVLDVSSTNERAIRLYLRHGLRCAEEISRIHKIF